MQRLRSPQSTGLAYPVVSPSPEVETRVVRSRNHSPSPAAEQQKGVANPPVVRAQVLRPSNGTSANNFSAYAHPSSGSAATRPSSGMSVVYPTARVAPAVTIPPAVTNSFADRVGGGWRDEVAKFRSKSPGASKSAAAPGSWAEEVALLHRYDGASARATIGSWREEASRSFGSKSPAEGGSISVAAAAATTTATAGGWQGERTAAVLRSKSPIEGGDLGPAVTQRPTHSATDLRIMGQQMTPPSTEVSLAAYANLPDRSPKSRARSMTPPPKKRPEHHIRAELQNRCERGHFLGSRSRVMPEQDLPTLRELVQVGTGRACSSTTPPNPPPVRQVPNFDPRRMNRGAALKAETGRESPRTPQATSPVIAIDVDEVLCQYVDSFRKFLQKERPDGPMDLESVFKEAHSPASPWRQQFAISGGLANLEVVPGAQAALRRLRSAGCRLEVVTSRPPIMRESTEALLAKLFTPDTFAAYHFVSGGEKGNKCVEIGAKVLVDDQLPNCEDASERGVKSILFDFCGSYPWSRQDTELPPLCMRSETWDETCEFLLQTLGLSSEDQGLLQDTLTLPKLKQPPECWTGNAHINVSEAYLQDAFFEAGRLPTEEDLGNSSQVEDLDKTSEPWWHANNRGEAHQPRPVADLLFAGREVGGTSSSGDSARATVSHQPQALPHEFQSSSGHYPAHPGGTPPSGRGRVAHPVHQDGTPPGGRNRRDASPSHSAPWAYSAGRPSTPPRMTAPGTPPRSGTPPPAAIDGGAAGVHMNNWHQEYGGHSMPSWGGSSGFHQAEAYTGEEAYKRWTHESSEVNAARQGGNFDPYSAQYAYGQQPLGSPVGVLQQRSVDMRQESWFGPDREDESMGCTVS